MRRHDIPPPIAGLARRVRALLRRRLPALGLGELLVRGAPWLRTRLRPVPAPIGTPRAAAALACAVGAGILVAALAGSPAPGSAATTPRVVAIAAPAALAAASIAPADLGALQAPAPPPPVVSPQPVAPSPAASTAAPQAVEPSSDDRAATSSTATDEPDGPQQPSAEPPDDAATTPDPPPVKHVVVVALADKGFVEAFGPASPAPFLARELRTKGVLLRRYFATAHGSLPNYLALLSGQAANPDTAAGCAALTPFAAAGKPASNGEVRGKGCVFAAAVPSLPAQLDAKRLAWRAYVDGAPDRLPGAPAAPCQPPAPAPDGTPAVVDRNPFLFFAAIASAADCSAKVTGFASLAADLAAPAGKAPAFTLIVPDACSAGRDGACPAGEPAGLARSDGWLREWVPLLLASPAYADDGMIVVVFDQARITGARADSTSCCDQALGINEPESVDPQAPAPGGGRVGALVLSPRVKAGIVSDVPYNHFALLRTIEDAFELDHLGLAGDGQLEPFGNDVFGER